MTSNQHGAMWRTALLTGQWRRLNLAIGIGAMTVLAGPTLLAASGWLIVRAAERPPILHLLVAIVSVRALALMRAAGAYSQGLIAHSAAVHGVPGLRAAIFEAVIPLLPGRLSRTAEGAFLSAVAQRGEEMQNGVISGIVPFYAHAVGITLVLVIAVVIHPASAALIAVGTVVATVASVAVVQFAYPDVSGKKTDWADPESGSDKTVANDVQLHAELVDVVSSAKTLMIAGANETRLNGIAEQGGAVAGDAQRLSRARAVTVAVSIAVMAVTTALVGQQLGSAITTEGADPHLLAPLVLLTLGSAELPAGLAIGWQYITTLNVASAQVAGLIPVDGERAGDAPDDAEDDGCSAVDKIGVVNLRVHHTVLEDFDLTVKKGEVVGLAGPSGTGKTTMARVLAGFVVPDEGHVTANGKAVPDVRHCLAVAGQNARLLPSSLAANVLLGAGNTAEDIDSDAIDRAIDDAQLRDWVDTLPEGTATHMGVGGPTLSGGQRRRVVLARALLSDRPFVIFDEPTTGLDAETAEAFLTDALKALRDRGVLIISHDDAALRRCDRVVHLNPM